MLNDLLCIMFPDSLTIKRYTSLRTSFYPSSIMRFMFPYCVLYKELCLTIKVFSLERFELVLTFTCYLVSLRGLQEGITCTKLVAAEGSLKKIFSTNLRKEKFVPTFL